MFFMNSGIGSRCGAVELCAIKVRCHHGKKKLVAVWRYPNRNTMRLHESYIRVNNGRMVFNSGSEEFINIVPKHLERKYLHDIA